jgi:hypothetical protein
MMTRRLKRIRRGAGAAVLVSVVGLGLAGCDSQSEEIVDRGPEAVDDGAEEAE